MRVHTTYECEKCRLVHPQVWQCALCELSPDIEPIAKVGDTITIKTRYDGLVKDVVMGVSLVPNSVAHTLQSWDTEEQWKENSNHTQFHEWQYSVEHEHQLGKDYYSNLITLDAIETNEQPGINVDPQ